MYESVPLHENTQYLEPCVVVLKEEWSRSVASRLAMLEKSNNNLPYSIVLLKRDQPRTPTCDLVGHSRLCKVFQDPQAAFVESVVIRKDHRGFGLGRKLMEETESHAKRLGMKTLYLTTHDKQGFYQHLGYEYCQPIISFGSASGLLSEQQLSRLVDHLGMNADGNQTKRAQSSSSSSGCQQAPMDPNSPLLVAPAVPSSSPPPPPLPPPPPCSLSPPPPATVSNSKVELWMKKQLT